MKAMVKTLRGVKHAVQYDYNEPPFGGDYVFTDLGIITSAASYVKEGDEVTVKVTSLGVHVQCPCCKTWL